MLVPSASIPLGVNPCGSERTAELIAAFHRLPESESLSISTSPPLLEQSRGVPDVPRFAKPAVVHLNALPND